MCHWSKKHVLIIYYVRDPVLVTTGDTEMNKMWLRPRVVPCLVGDVIIAVWGKGCKGTHRRVVKEGFLEEVWLDWNSGQVWLAGCEGKKALKVEGRSETRYMAAQLLRMAGVGPTGQRSGICRWRLGRVG